MTATEAGPHAEAPRHPPARPPAVDSEDRAVAADTAAPPPEELGAGDALPRLLKVVGGVVAPTSLLTALLFYFGRSRSAGYYRYFRVNSTVLDLTTNDYLFSGVDGLFVPIAVTCLLALVCVWLHRLLLTRVPGEARRLAVRVLVPAAALSGAVLVTLAFLDLLTEGDLFGANSPTGGVCLAVGVVLLLYAVRLFRLSLPPVGPVVRRRSEATGLAEWGAGFLLVSIGLFWAADGYAFGVGTGGAMTLHRALPTVPEAVVYSERSLSLGIEGVTEVRCADPEAAYRFRYTGLRLVRQAGNQYLLLPATWTRDEGTAVLIPRSAGVRLEFRAPTTAGDGC
ncbi:hypothetical protein [Blastococcus deserti]|uniref:Uncharacterized protein n=1 Tax=Blastococcus deserti TaxID=2259033 RepID=A0ABW4X7U4_9ACTN